MTRHVALLHKMAFSVAYAILAAISMRHRDTVTLSTLFWPPAGLLLAALMLNRPQQWPSWMAMAASVHLAISLFIGQRTLPVSGVFAIGDLIFCGAVAALWRKQCAHRDIRVEDRYTLTTLPNILGWFGWLAIFAFFVAWLVWLGLTWVASPTSAMHWYVWSLASFVGCIITTPLIIAGSRIHWTRLAQQNLSHLWLGLFAAFALLAGTTLVFNSPLQFTPGRPAGPFDLTYGPLLFLTFVAISWGPLGTSIVVAGLALIAGSYTMSGLGPYVGAAAFKGEPLLALQGYLGSAALLSLLTCALVRDREQALHTARGLKTQLDTALRISGYVAWEYLPGQGCLRWLGHFPFPFAEAAKGKTSLKIWLNQLHPEDRKKAQAWLEDEAGSHTSKPLSLRLRSDDGSYRDITMTGATLLHDNTPQEVMTGLLGVR